MKKNNKQRQELTVYDELDTTAFVDQAKRLQLADLGLRLPPEKSSKVVSLRIPTTLYNTIRAYATQSDIPYQAVMKQLLSKGIKKELSHHV